MALPIFPTADMEDVIAAYTSGNTVRFAVLGYFDFNPTPMALWAGEYQFTSGGVTWLPVNRVVSLEGLDEAASTQASDLMITLSGVESDLLALVQDEDESGYVGRMMMVAGQYFDADWSVTSSPIALKAGFMGRIMVTREKSDQGWVRTLRLPVSNLFAGRGIAPASFDTTRDQALRYPGTIDKGLDHITELQNKVLTEPWR